MIQVVSCVSGSVIITPTSLAYYDFHTAHFTRQRMK